CDEPERCARRREPSRVGERRETAQGLIGGHVRVAEVVEQRRGLGARAVACVRVERARELVDRRGIVAQRAIAPRWLPANGRIVCAYLPARGEESRRPCQCAKGCSAARQRVGEDRDHLLDILLGLYCSTGFVEDCGCSTADK